MSTIPRALAHLDQAVDLLRSDTAALNHSVEIAMIEVSRRNLLEAWRQYCDVPDNGLIPKEKLP